ncbi:hypothetical protein KDRO_B07400 [Kluyveromyces lactis]|nr:hypothetical protein KDRO_B07400 [Kluyveromyces lactis]
MVRRVEWKEVGVESGPTFLAPAYVTSKDTELVYTSGCVGSDLVTGKIPEDLETQVRNALDNLGRVLKASNSSFDDVLKILLFVADGSYATTVNAVYKEYFPERPARSCIVVSFPDPTLKVELECVAAVSST